MALPSHKTRDLDNRLALDQFTTRCEHAGIDWFLAHDGHKVTPEFRYELRVHEGPARGIYRGRTATHAATKAMAVLDEHRLGWDVDPGVDGMVCT